MRNYEVYENSGGGITLAILEDENPIKMFFDWEYGEKGILANAISTLADDPDGFRDWDGDALEIANQNAEICGKELYTLESLYEEISGNDDLIASGYNGIQFFEDNMGAAGMHVFGLEEED